MKRYVTELIGTFFLVLTIGCTVLGRGTGAIPPLAIGFALMVMVYAGGHISGAHYNPAVTLAVTLRGKASGKDLIPYWVAQIIGAVLAAFAVKTIYPEAAPTPAVFSGIAPLLAEFLFTFALAWVVLNVATAKANAGNSFYGLAIGSTVLAGAFSVGVVSGGAFNPAVAIGAVTMGIINPSCVWIHLVGDLAGGAAAAFAFKALVSDQS